MKRVAKENLKQLKGLLKLISKDDYNRKPDVLFGATIGQHFRHIIEFYMLMISGSFTDTISYDKRKRDIRIETDTDYAIEIIDKIFADIDKVDLEKPVIFKADFSTEGSSDNNIKSSVVRELAYCIEHSIHHQAIIKAGLIALGLNNLIDEDFGVAYSTIRYRNE